jgi:hypothetical protein
MLRGAHDLLHGGEQLKHDQKLFSSAHESHDDACEPIHWAEMFFS